MCVWLSETGEMHSIRMEEQGTEGSELEDRPPRTLAERENMK